VKARSVVVRTFPAEPIRSSVAASASSSGASIVRTASCGPIVQKISPSVTPSFAASSLPSS
jgi:hypothetical protein